MAKKKVTLQNFKRKGDYDYERYAQAMLKELPGHFLLGVSFSPTTGKYYVKCPEYSNVAETAFCVAVVAKSFAKAGIIENESVFTDLVTKYLNDPQYNETK